MISNAQPYKRPVLVLGAGVQQHRQAAREFVDQLGIPVCLTWGAADLLPETHPLRIGTFGTHGTRAANFAVQNADWLLSIGSRLDSKATGTPPQYFARAAHIMMCDIDQAEIRKMAKLGIEVEDFGGDAGEIFCWDFASFDVPEWVTRCRDWKAIYRCHGAQYDLIRHIAANTADDAIIVADTGCAVAWCMQAWEFKAGQRFLHPWNQTPMGYALPGALGAHYATGKPVTVITGDGSIMMSIGELASLRDLPVTIHLLDNKGHAMCRQTQREWMGGVYPSTSLEGGLKFPRWDRIIEAFPGINFHWHEVDPDADVDPKVKFGKPNEDMYPHLSRQELAENMLIPMVDA